MQTLCLGQEQSLIGGDGRPALQEVIKSGTLCTRRMNAFLRLIELLRIAKQHRTCGGLRNGEHVRQRHLASFIYKEHIDTSSSKTRPLFKD
jgi:hypothetical protein